MKEMQANFYVALESKRLQSVLLRQGLSGGEIKRRLLEDEYTYEDALLITHSEDYMAGLFRIKPVGNVNLGVADIFGNTIAEELKSRGLA